MEVWIAFSGPHGELSWIIVTPKILVIIGAIILLILNKIISNYGPIICSGCWSHFYSCFFMTPYSKFIWSSFPLLLMLQSNRLLFQSLSYVGTCRVFSNYSLRTKKIKIFLIFLIFVTIAYTIWIGATQFNYQCQRPTLRKNVGLARLWRDNGLLLK